MHTSGPVLGFPGRESGTLAEWFKALALKTSDAARHRGFESLASRQRRLSARPSPRGVAYRIKTPRALLFCWLVLRVTEKTSPCRVAPSRSQPGATHSDSGTRRRDADGQLMARTYQHQRKCAGSSIGRAADSHSAGCGFETRSALQPRGWACYYSQGYNPDPFPHDGRPPAGVRDHGRGPNGHTRRPVCCRQFIAGRSPAKPVQLRRAARMKGK